MKNSINLFDDRIENLFEDTQPKISPEEFIAPYIAQLSEAILAPQREAQRRLQAIDSRIRKINSTNKKRRIGFV